MTVARTILSFSAHARPSRLFTECHGFLRRRIEAEVRAESQCQFPALGEWLEPYDLGRAG